MQLFPLRRTLLWRCGGSRVRHTFRPHFVFCVLDFGSNPTILILRMTVAHSCISWLALQVTLLCTSGQSRMHYYCAKRQCIARLSEQSAVCCVFVRGTPQLPLSGFLFSLEPRTAKPQSKKTEARGNPVRALKLSAIHVHRRIVASTSCGKYLSRLFFIPFNHNVAMLRPTCPV